MAEKAVLTSRDAAELPGVSSGSASDVLAYMEAMEVVQRVKRGRYFYFLKGAYDEERLSEMLARSVQDLLLCIRGASMIP